MTYTCPGPHCGRAVETQLTGLCDICEGRLTRRLADILRNAYECSRIPAPERTGSSSSAAYGSRPAVNITTVDYAKDLSYSMYVTYDGSSHEAAMSGLAQLHSWERVIREERNLTRPYLVERQPTHMSEIAATCSFHVTHAPWSRQQPWADEYAQEVIDIHEGGLRALRLAPRRRAFMYCPGDDPETGDICNTRIIIPADFHEYVRRPGHAAPARTLWCDNCQTAWTFERLVRVSVSLHGVTSIARHFGKDFLAEHLGISVRRINQILQKERTA